MAVPADTAFELLRAAHGQQRLAHAYLFAGPPGSGKRPLAEKIAALATGAPEPRKHADVHIVEPESKSRRIVIDQMRALEHELQMRASGSGKKVGIIFDADRLQVQASNAFLKTLEEPPENSLLLLTSAQPETLPETILSRCIAVSLRRLGKRETTAAETQIITALTDFFSEGTRGIANVYGLVQKFSRLLQQNREAIAEENASELKTEQVHYQQTTESSWLDDREDHYKALTESRYLAQRSALLETLLQWWADVLRQQSGFRELDLPQCAAQTAALAQQFPGPEILRRLGHLEHLRENLDRNVKEDLALEVAFLNAFAK